MSFVAIIPAHIRRRWDAIAVSQLCAELLRQDSENERLQLAESDAEYWREQTLNTQDMLVHQHDLERGLTVNGDLVIIPKVSPAPDGSRQPSGMRAAPAVSCSLLGSRCREWSSSADVDGDLLEWDNATAAQALTAHDHY